MQGKSNKDLSIASLQPAIGVAVAADGGPLHLRWLLNALEDQTLAPERWEVVVTHDSGPETETLLRGHPLARNGQLRHIAHPTGSASVGMRRNTAWRLSRAPVIAFTDERCRPPANWLEGALAAALRHPGSIVQGRTEPDPDGWPATLAPFYRSRHIPMPPTGRGEACNVIYPRDALERAGGFDERLPVAEDVDLALRTRRAGERHIGAPEVLTYHAIEEETLATRLARSWRLRDLPLLTRAHPELRSELPLRVFWQRSHLRLVVATAGALLARRNRASLLLVAPWALAAWEEGGMSRRSPIRAAVELPERWLADSAELAALAWGSARHGSPLL